MPTHEHRSKAFHWICKISVFPFVSELSSLHAFLHQQGDNPFAHRISVLTQIHSSPMEAQAGNEVCLQQWGKVMRRPIRDAVPLPCQQTLQRSPVSLLLVLKRSSTQSKSCLYIATSTPTKVWHATVSPSVTASWPAHKRPAARVQANRLGLLKYKGWKFSL